MVGRLIFIVGALLMVVLLLSACTGVPGPAGPAGPIRPMGPMDRGKVRKNAKTVLITPFL